MLRTIYGDHERYKKQYWSEIPGMYFTGDGARRDEDGYFWIMGRIDDVINVAGHRIGTMEVESSLVSHPTVAEAAVVGRPDELKGQGIVAFVTLAAGHEAQPGLKDELQGHVAKEHRQLSRSRTKSGLPMRCPKRAAAKSCAACCATLRRVRPPLATRRRWKTSPYWRN